MGNCEKINHLKECVVIQRKWLRAQLCLTGVMFALGIVIIILPNLISSPVIQDSNQKLLFTVGGGFISSVATFPLKDVFSRREKIATLIFLQQQYENVDANKNTVD